MGAPPSCRPPGKAYANRASIETVDRVYHVAHLGALDRERLFWCRAGRRGEHLDAITRSWAKRMWKKLGHAHLEREGA